MQPRRLSLAYLTSSRCTAPEALRLAADLGCEFVGLRLLENTPGGPRQDLIGQPALLREMSAIRRGTGVGVLDLEIVRIGEDFDVEHYRPLLETGQALGARAVLVAGDDRNPARLAEGYAKLCSLAAVSGMTADLEFMPWTAVPDARAALDIVARAGTPPGAGILVDALHFDRSGTSIADIAAIDPGLLNYAQVCDAPTRLTPWSTDEMIHTARLERLPPGEGGIDLRGLFAALPQDLVVSVEVPNDARMDAVGQREWARLALQASRAVL